MLKGSESSLLAAEYVFLRNLMLCITGSPKSAARIPISQGIRRCIPVMVASKFTEFSIKGMRFVQNNSRTVIMGDIFILYDR
jgi:hypothetical protein